MRKLIAALRAFVMSALVVFVFNMMPTLANAQLSGRSLSLQILASQLKTPEQIAHYMWRNFRFETDRAHFGRDEYWQSPKETLASKKGDCEDFALFAQTLLRMNGRTAFLLNIHGSHYSHTIAVFKDGNICYDTHITDDVLGNLSDDDVTKIMKQIQELEE